MAEIPLSGNINENSNIFGLTSVEWNLTGGINNFVGLSGVVYNLVSIIIISDKKIFLIDNERREFLTN